MAAALAFAFAAGEFALSSRLELSFDEAYYLLWSRHLAWGYLDHPPMVAVWIRVSTAIFGDAESGVRALGVVAFTGLALVVGVSAQRLFDSLEVGVAAALAWLTMPLISGAFLATPDIPLTVFSALTLAGLVEVWRGRTLGWLAVGLALGAAMLAKFTALFLGAGVALALAATPSLRRWWASPVPYLAAFTCLAIFSPFLYWNATHDWVTFAKQFARVPASGLELRFLPEFLGGQLLLADPLFVVAVIAWILGHERRDGEPVRLLLSFVAPACGYFFAHSLHDRVQANWLAPLYPAFAILVGAAMIHGAAWIRGLAAVGVTVGALAIAVILAHAATSWPALGLADPLARIGDWREIASEVDAIAHSEQAAYIFAHGYASTSLLTVYGDGATPVLQAEERDRWSFLPAPDKRLFERPGLAFGDAERGFDLQLARHFHRVEPLGRIVRRVGGVEAGLYELYRIGEPYGSPFEPL